MNAERRKALEARGYKVYDHAGDAVGMTEAEKQLLDARFEMAFAVRRLREATGLSQKDLAIRLKTSQPRVAKIERAAPDVAFDQLLRAYLAVGGRIVVKNGRTGRKKASKLADMQIELGEPIRS